MTGRQKHAVAANGGPSLDFDQWAVLTPEVEDLREEATAQGWTIDLGYHYAMLRRRNIDIWICRSRWAVAERAGLTYRKHRYFDTLREALDSVSGGGLLCK